MAFLFRIKLEGIVQNEWVVKHLLSLVRKIYSRLYLTQLRDLPTQPVCNPRVEEAVILMMGSDRCVAVGYNFSRCGKVPLPPRG